MPKVGGRNGGVSGREGPMPSRVRFKIRRGCGSGN
jgi:hypothetical protein